MDNFYLIPEEALPEVFVKILAVRSRLATRKGVSVSMACREEGLSRSTYYKYRDAIHLFRQEETLLVDAWVQLASDPSCLRTWLERIATLPATLLSWQTARTAEGVRVSLRWETTVKERAGFLRALREEAAQFRGLRTLKIAGEKD